MSVKLLACQQDDGLWRASLLDPASYPLKETSSSGFCTYAFAWGVNQGLLDRATFEPAVRKAWAALVACVQPDGKLTHVQPIGADPKKFDDNATEVYGVGAFLLAGSEVYRLAAAVTPKPGATVEKATNPPAIAAPMKPWRFLGPCTKKMRDFRLPTFVSLTSPTSETDNGRFSK